MTAGGGLWLFLSFFFKMKTTQSAKGEKMVDISKASAKTLLGIAIRAEMDANKTYTDLAKSVRNPLLKEKFKILAFEENGHKLALTKIFAKQYKGENPVIPDAVDKALLPAVHLTPTSSLVDILIQAMKSEQASEDFYTRLSKRVESEPRKILEYLSRVEHSHYMMLKSEFVLAQEFEDYAEKDLDKVIT